MGKYKESIAIFMILAFNAIYAGKNKDLSSLDYAQKAVALYEFDYYQSAFVKSNNIPALAAAAQLGYFNIVEAFVEANKDLNIKCLCGTTPLMLACCKGHKQIVELLLKSGADFKAKNKWNQTALSLAKQYKHKEIEKLLKDCYLVSAVNENKIKRVKFWVKKKKLSSDLKTLYGTPILTIACEKGYLDIVKFLIENGADVNAKDKGGNPPLICAAMFNSIYIVKLLIENGADINFQSYFGKFKLKDFIKSKFGAKSKKQKISPLLVAIIQENIDVVKTLLEYGADIKANCPFNLKLVSFTKDAAIKELISTLEDVDCDFNLFKCQSIEIKKLLIKRWASQNKDIYLENLNQWIKDLPDNDSSKILYNNLILNNCIKAIKIRLSEAKRTITKSKSQLSLESK